MDLRFPVPETGDKKPECVLDRRNCPVFWRNSNSKRSLIEDELRRLSDEIVDEMNKGRVC